MNNNIFEKEWKFAEKILLDQAKLEEENKQLKEQLENNFDKGKESMQQRIDKAIEYIKNASYFDGSSMCANDLLEILGDKENE